MPIVVDLCWGVGGGGGEREERVYSNTRVNNNCSVDSDDDFAEVIEATNE